MFKDFLITGATLLTMQEDQVLTGQDVLIADGKIKKILLAGQLTVENKIDGKGCFLMPGFCDMHVHLTSVKDDLFLYLANGVTTIRNMSGMQLPAWTKIIPGLGFVRHINIKKEIASGRITGPEIFNCTPMLDVPPFYYPWPATRKVINVKHVPHLIKQFKKRGFDFIKVYSKLSAAVFKAIIEHGHRMGMQVGGHVPYAMSVDNAINAGIDFIEHLIGYINTGIPHENDVKVEDLDPIVQLTIEKGVWNCPTLLVWKTLNKWIRFRELKTLKYLKYMPPRSFGISIRRACKYEKIISAFLKKHPIENYQIVQNYQHLAPLAKKLAEKGALMMTGTDANTPFVVPGFSLHDEFQMLAEAGIPNNEILKMTTCLPAKFLNREQEAGTVEEGKLANLVLLNADPRKDIRNTKKIAGVMRKGEWFSKDVLQKGLDTLAAKYERANKSHFKVMQEETG